MSLRLPLLIVCALAFPTFSYGQKVALSTNIVDYANYGTINMEAQVSVSRRFSIAASAKYNPFSYDGGTVLKKQRLASLGGRFWPWYVYSGWWIGAKAQYQEYNESGKNVRESREGDRFGASFSAGFSHMLSKHLNLELGAGMWAGYDIYTSYACPECGRKTGEGKETFILPNDLMVSLSYIF